MIGLAVKASDLEAAKEFFELFKTPWEPAVPGRRYKVILSTDGSIDPYSAELFLVYSSEAQVSDGAAGIAVNRVNGPVEIRWAESTFPLYRGVGLIERERQDGTLKARGKSIDCRYSAGERTVWRIGYDLFDEIQFLLTEGQPAALALTPTLDLHIELLRQLLVESKVAFLEIPPRPANYDFICCLTHDVDFFGIRRHKFDRTMGGVFVSCLYRVVDRPCAGASFPN